MPGELNRSSGIFAGYRETQEIVFSEAYRSLSVGSRPSLLSRFASCGVSVVSLYHWSRANASPNT